MENKKGKKRAEALVSPFKREYYGEEYVKERIEKDIPILGNTGKPCSCEMCRNPRRSGWNVGKHKLTIQELKQIKD